MLSINATVHKNTIQKYTTKPFYSHYISRPVIDGTPSSKPEDFIKAEFYCPQAQPLLTATSAFKTEEDATDFLSDLTYTICIPYAEYKNTVYKRQQYADRLNNTFAIMKQ